MIELKFTVFSLLLSIALIIALTFGFLLLFSRHENKKADRFLALLMFIVALWNASMLILVLNIYRYAVGIIWVPLTYTLALGPCFYFYIRYMTDADLSNKLRNLFLLSIIKKTHYQFCRLNFCGKQKIVISIHEGHKIMARIYFIEFLIVKY